MSPPSNHQSRPTIFHFPASQPTMTEINKHQAHTSTATWLGVIPRDISRYSWLILLNTWLSWAMNALTFAMIYVLGTVIISDFQLSPMNWGLIVSGYLAVRVLCDIPVSIISDRIGRGWRRKLVWFPMMMLYAVAGTLIAIPSLSGTVTGFCLLLIGIALGTTASEALGVVSASEWWPREHCGFAIGVHHTGYPIGALMGGGIAAATLSVFGEDGWRMVYLTSILTMPFAIWYWFLATQAHQEAVEQHDREVGLTPSVEIHDDDDRVSLRSCFEAAKNREVLIFGICALLFQAMQNVFQTSYPEYLKFVGGLGAASVAGLTVVWSITGAFFQFLWPTISDRIGRKWFIVGAGVIQALVFVLLPYCTTVPAAIGIQLLYGVTLNAVFPLLFASTADIAGKRIASALGVVFSLLWLGAVLGTLFASVILQSGGGFTNASAYRLVYFLMPALCTVIIVLRLLVRETNPPQRPHRVGGGTAGDLNAPM
jgi:MFS family permease